MKERRLSTAVVDTIGERVRLSEIWGILENGVAIVRRGGRVC
jgi:hypothetical protein